jgi:hypothetical protein
MKMSGYWQDVMDQHKRHRAEAEAAHNGMAEVLYGRAEMLARAEVELCEAEEKVEAKR